MNEFESKVGVVTGGAQGIGKCICDQFRKEEAIVCDIDILPGGLVLLPGKTFALVSV